MAAGQGSESSVLQKMSTKIRDKIKGPYTLHIKLIHN